ncbi:MAG TPA: hypothetical protein VI544_01885 [Candidatus Nanoarchaeia archaeon]|nr:hypothetical protein [Candidatus Nanoarchaeia archaeon]
MVKKRSNNDEKRLVSFILRSGLALVFFYASISAFVNPIAWAGYVPNFIKQIISVNSFLLIHSSAEMILGFWLLSGKKTFYASLASAAAMFSIIAFNLTALDIVFRDVAIMLSAIALAVLHYKGD